MHPSSFAHTGSIAVAAFCLSSLLGGITAFAQLYVPGGASAVGSSANGYVGIGTSNPVSALHVDGFTTTHGVQGISNFSVQTLYPNDDITFAVSGSTGALFLASS